MIALIALLVLFTTCTQTSKKVMLVFSYGTEYEWVIEETQGVMDVFAGENIVFEKFYMNTKQHTEEQWIKDISAKAIAKIDEFQPDVLMVFDDNACKYVAEHYNGSDLNVVFCGMNGYPVDYGFPSQNVTGIVEKELWQESYDLVVQLDPGVTNAVILLDSSATSAVAAKRIESLPLMKDLLGVYRIHTFEMWKEIVTMLQDSTGALGMFVYFSIKDGAGNPVPSEEVLEWTLQNNSLPEFAILDFTVKGGALCGVSVNGSTQGKMAAEMALRILDGESPANIPVVAPPKGEKHVNQKRVGELGITIPESVLKDATIVK